VHIFWMFGKLLPSTAPGAVRQIADDVARALQ
jgi:hypothetical protein